MRGGVNTDTVTVSALLHGKNVVVFLLNSVDRHARRRAYRRILATLGVEKAQIDALVRAPRLTFRVLK